MQRQPRILVISDRSVDFCLPMHWDVVNVFYAFSTEKSPNGFSAWQIEPSSFLVDYSCKALAGGFSLQALNRPLLQMALKQKIDGVLLVGLYGCTIDLPRVFNFLGVPVAWALQPDIEDIENVADRFTVPWLKDALTYVNCIWGDSWPLGKFTSGDSFFSPSDFISAFDVALGNQEQQSTSASYDYSLYEFGLRDHPLLCAMQAVDVRHFNGCNCVLDLGCGSGIFLSLLEQQGVAACGVERNDPIARYARGMGLDVITADAVQFAAETDRQFDGIYCSHFVEHLPVELVEKLLASLSHIVEDNGVVVLTFPDPESIRSQLLGFWRDPEHVRFYHPELIISFASAVDLELVWSSYEEQPHKVVAFSHEPDPLPELQFHEPPLLENNNVSLSCKLLRKLIPGIHEAIENMRYVKQEMAYQNAFIKHQQAVIEQLAVRTEKLWDINQTWAWNDNVTLKFRRRPR